MSRRQVAPCAGEGGAALQLAPEPSSVAAARRFVAERVRGWGADEAVVDTCVLLASELATNALLHAGTPFSVAVCGDGDGVVVDVRDGEEALPVVHRFAATSTTGRGLRLLVGLAEDWAATAAPDGSGKSVRFRVPLRSRAGSGGGADGPDGADGAGAGGAQGADEAAGLEGFLATDWLAELEGPAADDRPAGGGAERAGGGAGGHVRGAAGAGRERGAAAPPAASSGAGSAAGSAAGPAAGPSVGPAVPPSAPGARPEDGEVRLRLLHAPVALWARSEAHRAELLREFRLLAAAGEGESAEPAGRLVHVLPTTFARYQPLAEAVDRARAGAAREGSPWTDAAYDVPPEAVEELVLALPRVLALLEEADELCRRGTDLLTLAAPPQVAAFRRWYVHELVGQLRGGPAHPWTGPAA
ncbi:ATP-binding protein [Vallicoccus soli]|uniref:ATP-binding protein n=1 Tax=Vallicoccus soli TaxID=2339232 RepID=UPI001059AC5B|nr:ATP-binding protein [Vallicoccus soli]